jgi:hypothetical protein
LQFQQLILFLLRGRNRWILQGGPKKDGTHESLAENRIPKKMTGSSFSGKQLKVRFFVRFKQLTKLR